MPSHSTSTPDWLQVQSEGNNLYLQPTAKTLKEAEGRFLTEYLRSSLEDSPKLRGIALDLANVELITSPAIGALIVIHKRLSASNRKLVLFNLSDTLTQTLSFLKLDDLFTVCGAAKDVEKALSTD